MGKPHLTFFCELDGPDLEDLFSQSLLQDLIDLQAGVSLGIRDFSRARAEAVRRLNRAGIPVTAWLLLPEEQGYWFNIDNAHLAGPRYEDFRAWSRANDLEWEAIGLDIEPDIREMQALGTGWWRLVPVWLRRALNPMRTGSARRMYFKLIRTIRNDGYRVESYQIPIIEDERRAGSRLLQRMTGILDLPVDREVWMLYTSFLRSWQISTGAQGRSPAGPAVLASYAPDAQAVALGSTGGGVEPTGNLNEPPLTWEELARDLRLAWFWHDHLYIFSLEGCARQGFLPRLKSFEWDVPILLPEEPAQRIGLLRGNLRALLWATTYTRIFMLGLVAGLFFVWRWRHRRQ